MTGLVSVEYSGSLAGKKYWTQGDIALYQTIPLPGDWSRSIYSDPVILNENITEFKDILFTTILAKYLTRNGKPL